MGHSRAAQRALARHQRSLRSAKTGQTGLLNPLSADASFGKTGKSPGANKPTRANNAAIHKAPRATVIGK
jgi:hypothetical protein